MWTGLLPRVIFTGTIFMKFGRISINYSETEAGQKRGNVLHVTISGIARETDCITGMEVN
jgi:hypothetical protein